MTCFLSSLRFVKVTTMLVKILMVCLVTSFTMKAAVYSTSEGSSACKLDDDYNPYGMGPPCCRFFEKQLRCCDDARALSLSLSLGAKRLSFVLFTSFFSSLISAVYQVFGGLS
jgi:hypothetical protein